MAAGSTVLSDHQFSLAAVKQISIESVREQMKPMPRPPRNCICGTGGGSRETKHFSLTSFSCTYACISSMYLIFERGGQKFKIIANAEYLRPLRRPKE